MVKMIENKRGWIRLLEAFVAIVLLTSVLVIISSNNSTYKNDMLNEISERQIAVLRNIQLDETLRSEILGATLPVEWEQFESEVPAVLQRINALSPKEFYCMAKICEIDDPCPLEQNFDAEIYAKSVVIAANAIKYSPRQLKLFCIDE